MESSRPRSVLAAFQERLQLASSKCGSLMEQLNIVRKKVEGEEAIMEVSESVSNYLLENVSKENILQTEILNPLDCKDAFNKEQIAEDDTLQELSTAHSEYDVENKSSFIYKTHSQHSKSSVKEEQVAFLMREKSVAVEEENHSVESAGAFDSHHSKGSGSNDQILGKSGGNISVERVTKSLSEEMSSDEAPTLSSYSSSNGDSAEGKDKQNIYEELLKRLKDNEEKKFSKKSRSSSENSSSTIPQSFKSNKSSNNNFSDCSINEDKFEKKNGEIDNLNSSGVDFFLPSSVTEKFQEIFYEDSDDEVQETNGKDKNTKVSFDSMITTMNKKHSLCNEKLTEKKKKRKKYLQNQDLNENILKPEIIPMLLKTHNNIHTFKNLTNLQQKTKVKDKNCDTASIQTKSETTKKSKKVVNTSIAKNIKIHSPEMTLYKKLNTVPTKLELQTSGKKDIKQKKTPVITYKVKGKNVTMDPKLKNVSEKTMSETNTFAKQVPKESPIFKNNTKLNKDINEMAIKNPPIITTYSKKCNEITNRKKIPENKVALNIQPKIKNGVRSSKNMEGEDIISSYIEDIQNNKTKNVKSKIQVSKNNNYLNKKENSVLSQDKLQIRKNKTNFKPEEHELLSNSISRSGRISKIPLYNGVHNKTSAKDLPNKHSLRNENEKILDANAKLKSHKESNPSEAVVQLPHVKKELSKVKTIMSKKEDKLDNRSPKTFNNTNTKDQIENVRRKQNLSKETISTQNINDIKILTTSFPFILGQSTSKTYNVRAAIQQTMSMIVKSPAEMLRRSSFSEMFNVSSKGSTHKSCSSYSTSRKVCPACVARVDEDEEDLDDTPIDPWDTEYHSKRFIRCTCMPRNTVNFKTVMNQLLLETSSYCPPSESYQESELENGEESRVTNSFFRRNNNIYKLSKLLHNLLRIRDLLIT